MKLMRAFLVLVVLMLCSMQAHANSITVIDVSATTCISCFGYAPPSVSIDAQFTVMPVTGTFFNSGIASYFSGTVLQVVAIKGLLDGQYPMSLVPGPYGGVGSWLNTDYSLGTVYFSANGNLNFLEFDNLFNLLETAFPSGYGTNTPINWSAVPAPEPPSFVFLAVGLVGLVFLKLRAA